MQYPIKTLDGKRGRLLLLGTLAGTGIWLLRRPLLQVAGLVLGGAALAFLEFPAANLFEKRFPRPTAALLGLLSIWGGLGVALWLMLPPNTPCGWAAPRSPTPTRTTF